VYILIVCFLYVVLLVECSKPCSLAKEIQHTEIMVCILLHTMHLTFKLSIFYAREMKWKSYSISAEEKIINSIYVMLSMCKLL